ncbi:MAG TPA: CHAT domain-containing protein, partial [Pyrinomonadaceae bacterium]|nr:CHAT domain-containing protein [Pyrinomonadaceae bacterium]
ASAACELAMNIATRLNDKRGMFLTLRVQGGIARVRGNYKQALEYLEQALKIAHELGDKADIANALNSMAIVYAMQSDYPKALELFQQSLKIKETLGDKLDIARDLSNIGNIYILQADRGRALEYFQRGLKLAEEIGYKPGYSATLNSIGALYHAQGNYAQALEYYQRSLKVKQEIGDKLGAAFALTNIGVIHSAQGQYAQAFDYLQQNLKIREELGDKAGIVEVSHHISRVYLRKGDYAQALDHTQGILKPAEALGNNAMLAEILQTVSDSHLRLGQYQQASENAERAVSLAVKFNVLEVLWNAHVIAGKAHLRLNQPELARHDFLESIATIEKLRNRVAGGEQDQQCFFENKIAPYQALVQLSLAQRNFKEALTFAERAKARVLLDVLNSRREDITKGMTADELKRHRELVAEIASLNTELTRLKTQSKPPEAQVTEIQSRLDKARLEYEAFQASLYAAHPELKVQRGQTQILTLDEAAALLPDQRTAILEYVVTEDKSYLFVLKKTAAKDIGAKGAIDLTVYTLNLKSSELATMAESFRQRVANRDLAIKQPARQLYDLLIKPAEGALRDVRKICIVPDGPLWNVPFQALHGERNYLLEQYALFYAPSLSVLREMGKRANQLKATHRQTARERGPFRKTVASGSTRAGLLAMGNPSLSGETVAKVRFAHRDGPLSPLPDAEREVNLLGRLYGPDASRVMIGPQAREAIVKAEAGKYEILHFATHATLDDRNPLYSGIVLSRAEDETHEDGLLEAWEIMKLDLNASLTVLSACETARGRVADGEGMIGISWALFVAGSPAAVVSQWKVDSARTSELMIEFHQSLLRKPRSGEAPMTKSEALRQASLKLLRGPYNHPAYWAGFVLIGDDN